MNAEEIMTQCGRLEARARAKPTARERENLKREALRLKIDAYRGMKTKRTRENCDSRSVNLAPFRYFAAYCKACDLLKAL